jgi:type II secretory ATPase GspE/PulE/Tfp pilus assembly ATPase PilB-like protein
MALNDIGIQEVMEKKGDNENVFGIIKHPLKIGLTNEITLYPGQKMLEITAYELVRLSEAQARGYLAKELAFRLEALPLRVESRSGVRTLAVAIANSKDHELIKRISFSTGLEAYGILVRDEVLKESIEQLYLGDHRALSVSVQALSKYGESVISHQPEVSFADTNEVTAFISRLIEYAIAHHASDIHLSARRNGTHVQMRISGELLDHEQPITSLEVHKQLVSRIKVLAALDITERNKPQDGSIRFPLSDRTVDVRVSILPTSFGENVVLRIFARQRVQQFDSLGYDSEIQEQIYKLLESPKGALIVSGPTGSGKTTALYSILEIAKTKRLAVSTIEDPVEVIIDGIAQTSITEGLDYHKALQSVLRQDPDLILVGELRSEKSARVALEASLSGHQILSTIHGATVIEALRRFESFGIERGLLIQALEMLISQRLINRLCSKCRVFDLKAANSIGCDVYKPVGCSACDNSGFSGRILIAESLILSEEVKDFLLQHQYISAKALQIASVGSYRTFKQQSTSLLERGEITYQQYLVFQ